MVCHLAARIQDLPNDARIQLCLAAQDKECRFGTVLFQDFKNLRRVEGVGSIVKGQRYGVTRFEGNNNIPAKPFLERPYSV